MTYNHVCERLRQVWRKIVSDELRTRIRHFTDQLNEKRNSDFLNYRTSMMFKNNHGLLDTPSQRIEILFYDVKLQASNGGLMIKRPFCDHNYRYRKTIRIVEYIKDTRQD